MPPENRTYRKISYHYADQPWLDVEAWMNLEASEYFMFSIRMARLVTGEESLNSGRFSLFSDEIYDYTVDISFKNEWNSYETLFTERLDWISQNVTDNWGFDINVPHLGIGSENTLSFSFKNLTDALRFKLSF
jgi:hypothetical protein